MYNTVFVLLLMIAQTTWSVLSVSVPLEKEMEKGSGSGRRKSSVGDERSRLARLGSC